MSLVVVDDGRVVQLRRAHAEAVVGVRRDQQEQTTLQKSGDQRLVLGRRRAEDRLLRGILEPAGRLGQEAGIDRLLQMAIDRGRPPGQVGPAIRLSRAQIAGEFIELAHGINLGFRGLRCKKIH